MNQRKAFKETIDEAFRNGMSVIEMDNPSLTFDHLNSMYQRIMEADEAGQPFSEAKIGRWLGWAQCAVVASDCGLTLEDMKNINHSFAGDSNEG